MTTPGTFVEGDDEYTIIDPVEFFDGDTLDSVDEDIRQGDLP